MKKIIMGLLLLFLFAIPAIAQWNMSEFMIYTWPPQFKSPDEVDVVARTLAEAGFTCVRWPLDKLELCRKYGLKLMVDKIDPEGAAKYSNDPAVWGYYIIDEPLINFPALRERVKAFHKADPTHPAYINLVSRCGNYLKSYMEIVQPEILSYDYYQWWWGTDGHFTKLAHHRNAALKANVPLICWLEVNANQNEQYLGNDNSYVPDNAQKIRQSAFTSITYGLKGIEWFYGVMMYERDRPVLNQCGRDVAAINAELKVLGPVLMKLKSVDVFHTEPLPRDAKGIPDNYWIQLAESWYPGLVMGMFKDDEDNDFVMITNTNYAHEKLAVLEFCRPIQSVEKLNKKTGMWEILPINKGVTEANQKLVRSNLYFQMYSQKTGGDLILHMDDVEKRWFRGKSGNQLAEFMLAPGDGELLRIMPDLDLRSTRQK